MGICIQSIDNALGPMEQDRSSVNGWMWLVMRRDPNAEIGSRWHIQGLASSELAAITMCVDSNYLIGPLPVDMALQEARMDWAGSYFPLANPIVGK